MRTPIGVWPLALCVVWMTLGAVACVDPSITAIPPDGADERDAGNAADEPDAPLDAGEPDAGGEDVTADAIDVPDADEPDGDDMADADGPDIDEPDVDEPPDEEAGPARYPSDTLRSPVTEHVAQSMRQIRARSNAPNDLVFMKVGASGTVSRHLLHCFAGPERESSFELDLDGRQDLLDTIEFFRMAELPGPSNAFNRETIAARVGRSATWAISGDPSPLESEIDAINPRFALVNYGTNDMSLGITHQSALWPFYANFTALLDQLIERGIVPIITGLNPRTDDPTAASWVPTYDAVTRGVAEALQVPYFSMRNGAGPLADQGLVSDGIHGNTYRDERGRPQPCIFNADGLEFGYNVRNLLTIESFHDARLVTLEEAPAPDISSDRWQGQGSSDDPFVIDRLPFTHHANTADAPQSELDAYPACDNGQDESGPEYHYRLELTQATPVRIMAFDGAGVDVDIHLLGPDGTPESCLARDDKIIERTLEPGTWTVVVDTFVSRNNGPQPGPYLLVVGDW